MGITHYFFHQAGDPAGTLKLGVLTYPYIMIPPEENDDDRMYDNK